MSDISTHTPDAGNMEMLPKFYGKKYTDILLRQLQVTANDVERYMTAMTDCKGSYVVLHEISNHEMHERTQRHEPVKREEHKFGARGMRPRLFAHTSTTSSDDIAFNTDIDLTLNSIVQEEMSALKRMSVIVMLGLERDTTPNSPTFGLLFKRVVTSAPSDIYNGIAGGLLGTNYIGQDGIILEDLGSADTGNAMTTNVIDQDFVYDGTPVKTGLTFDKIRRGVQLLKTRLAHVPGVTTCVIAMTAAQRAELERVEAATNTNYGMGSMKDGITNTFLGVTILETEMLPVEIIDGKVVQICPMWVKEHATYGTWANAKVKVDGDLEDFYDTGQVKVTASLGAARKSKASVIQIMCHDKDLSKITV